MRAIGLIALPLAACTLLAGCGDGARDEPGERATPAPHVGGDDLPAMPGTAPETVVQVPEREPWRLQWLAGHALPDSGTLPTLELDAASSSAAGSGGVNRFGASYELGAQRLVFGELASTRMAGPPELMALEQAYLGALARVDGWRRVEGGLELVAGDEVLMRLVPALDD